MTASKTKSPKANSVVVSAKVDADLKARCRAAWTRGGMTESAFLRLALESYLGNAELHTIAAEITRASGVVAAAAQSVSQPMVISRMDSLEKRMQEQLKELRLEMRELLGEPVEADGAVN